MCQTQASDMKRIDTHSIIAQVLSPHVVLLMALRTSYLFVSIMCTQRRRGDRVSHAGASLVAEQHGSIPAAASGEAAAAGEEEARSRDGGRRRARRGG